jgi:transcriptional regulator with XRE-family HTH domain
MIARWWNLPMFVRSPWGEPAILDGLKVFGERLRNARYRLSLSQTRLEELSGVDQTSISRLERGLAPRFPAEKLIRLSQALGVELPLGACPHDHPCRWQAPGQATRRPPMFGSWR